MELRYTVTGTNAASAELKNFTLTPAPGTVENITGITLEYPDLTEELAFPDGITDVTRYLDGRITLTRLDNDPYLSTVYEVYSATLRDNNKIDLLFKNRVSMTPEPRPETISRLGDYRLTVLPNTFKLKNNTFAFNARVEAYYTVSRDVPENRMESYVLDPADGEETGKIDLMSITFPEASEGLVYPIDKTRITLTNTADAEDTYQACALMLQGNRLKWGWNRPSYPYDDHLTIDREGTYLLRIEPGTMTDYENPSQSNPEITALIHVSADSDFAYTLTPAPGAYTELETIGISAAGNARDLRVTGEAGEPATLREAHGTEYILECSDVGEFSLPATLAEGTYTLTIPASYFVQTNGKGKEVRNRVITAEYRKVRPSQYSATLIPASGSELSGLSSISVIPAGADMRGFGIDETAGTPLLGGNGRDIALTPSLSQYSVSFLLPDGETLAPGEYTFTLPGGYVTVTDGNGIETSLDAVTARYTIREGVATQVRGGIFFLNEGVFGSEFGSLDYLEDNMTTLHYDVLGEANAGKTPGVTTQYGCVYGSRLYLMGKQTSYDNTASLFTVADAGTLQIERQTQLTQGEGRAVCPVDSDKVYVGTSDGVLVYGSSDGEIEGVIEGTAAGGGKYRNQTGDMIRLGRYVFAAAQDKGVFVIDTTADRLVSTLPIERVSGLFVTGEGRLYASTECEETPFVEIDSESLETMAVATDAAPVSSSWGSWKSIPVAADIRGNRIYYVASGNTGAIASYDFDTDSFKPNFISIPSIDGHRMQAYGTAVSTDPVSGYIVVSAIGDFGTTDRNAIFFANPADGRVVEGMTLRPERKYWFPAMSFYTPGEGPVLSPVPPLTLLEGTESELDCTALTYLSVGNRNLIIYNVVSSAPAVCTGVRTANGRYTLSGKKKGMATLTVTADYRGMTARTDVAVTVTDDLSVSSPEVTDAPEDVYDISGRLILRDATEEQIRLLAPGLYIIGKKKHIIL